MMDLHLDNTSSAPDDRKPRDKSTSDGSTKSNSAMRKDESPSDSEHSPKGDTPEINLLDQHQIACKTFIEMAAKYRHYPELTDDFKSDAAYEKHGGFALRDKELLGRLRSSGTEVVKMVGKKIFSGKFNLTQISFPIKCMQPKSII
jgi:hypothetical protein